MFAGSSILLFSSIVLNNFKFSFDAFCHILFWYNVTDYILSSTLEENTILYLFKLKTSLIFIALKDIIIHNICTCHSKSKSKSKSFSLFFSIVFIFSPIVFLLFFFLVILIVSSSVRYEYLGLQIPLEFFPIYTSHPVWILHSTALFIVVFLLLFTLIPIVISIVSSSRKEDYIPNQFRIEIPLHQYMPCHQDIAFGMYTSRHYVLYRGSTHHNNQDPHTFRHSYKLCLEKNKRRHGYYKRTSGCQVFRWWNATMAVTRLWNQMEQSDQNWPKWPRLAFWGRIHLISRKSV